MTNTMKSSLDFLGRFIASITNNHLAEKNDYFIMRLVKLLIRYKQSHDYYPLYLFFGLMNQRFVSTGISTIQFLSAGVELTFRLRVH